MADLSRLGRTATGTRLCRSSDARGNLLPDAYLAAVAMERGAAWYSADRNFSRFAGLRWHHPLEARAPPAGLAAVGGSVGQGGEVLGHGPAEGDERITPATS
ncbi:MAG: hypothetical protein ACR2HY_09595 [Acidimicrobiales bacterium]